MSNEFVWFHNGSNKPTEAAKFYENLLGWKPSAGPPGTTMLAREAAPFAGLGPPEGETAAWIPFVEVKDVDDAVKRAVKLGGAVIKERTRGPAGEFSIVRDPGGAAFAVWQKA